MAKPTSSFTCNSCGAAHQKWAGKCDACGAWNSLTEEKNEATPKGLTIGKGKKIEWEELDAQIEDLPRQASGIGELDRVLGGGLVPGSAILIGGDPGIGKSTILLQAMAAIARSGSTVSYVSGEESISQVRLRAKRLGLGDAKVELASATSVRDIIASIDIPKPPQVVVIDSIQTMYLDNLDAAPGTVSQVRASAHELIKIAKKRHMAMFLVGHVTKDGQIAGPRVLEHMVDTVLYFEGERGHQFRILRSVKNRFGGTDEIGVFAMTDKGLEEVSNPSSLFLSQREHPVSGSAVFAGMEGSRPILVEVQALVSSSPMSTPRRAVVGWDSGRLAMLLAVLEARCGITLHDKEVYLNVAGGMRILEPAADLAVAAALLSALSNIPTPNNTVFFGEIGLSGEIRAVGRTDARLKESEKLGFSGAYIPATTPMKGATTKPALGTRTLSHVQELVSIFSAAPPQTKRA